MKLKILSLLVAATFIISCGTTYKSVSNNAAYNVAVPASAQGHFAAQFPDATNIVWNAYDASTVPIDWDLAGWTALDANDFVVTFNLGAEKYYAWYDSDGTLIGTAYTVSDYSKLPYAVSTTLQNNYKDYTIESVQREMKGTQTVYEIKLASGDMKKKILVDMSGNVIKEKDKS